MAWCLVKHRDNLTFYFTFSQYCYGSETKEFNVVWKCISDRADKKRMHKYGGETPWNSATLMTETVLGI
jgi:hypothetical protein